MARTDWESIVEEAANIVESYSTGVTLRQLFYRLVSAEVIANTQNAYKGLSRYTARARRAGWFPDLIDRQRAIHRYRTFRSSDEALDWVRAIYRRPRDENQAWSIYIGVEKSGIVEQLTAWFGDFGIPILALGGYSSQSYVDTIVKDVQRQGRPAVLIYAGDFDPSGEDIERDFVARTDCWDQTMRIALTPQQIIDYALPPLPGKATDSRAARFALRHGQLMQVELDALDPNDLRNLYQQSIDRFWDEDIYTASVLRERREARQMVAGDVVLDLADARNLLDAIAERSAAGDGLPRDQHRSYDILRHQVEADDDDQDDDEESYEEEDDDDE